MDLHAQHLDVVGAVRAARKVRQVQPDLVPALIRPHVNRADEWLDTLGHLAVGRAQPATHVLDFQNLDLEDDLHFQIFDDHDQERQLDALRIGRLRQTRDLVGASIRTHDLQHGRLDVLVRDVLDVPIEHLLVQNLQRLVPVQRALDPNASEMRYHRDTHAPDAVED